MAGMNAGGPGVRVQVAREWLPEGQDAPSGPRLGLEDGHMMTGTIQLEGGRQSGQAGADHDDPKGTSECEISRLD